MALVVIKFELLEGRCYIIPLIMVALASEWIGDSFSKDVIYHAQNTLVVIIFQL